MSNPYEPPTTRTLTRKSRAWFSRYTFAGGWLAGVGVVHFVAMNLISGTWEISQLEWSPLLLVVIGGLVALKMRPAIVLTRIVGTFMTCGLIVSTVLSPFVAGAESSEITYGKLTIAEPAAWQGYLMLGAMAVSILPPWYALIGYLDEIDGRHRSNSKPLIERSD